MADRRLRTSSTRSEDALDELKSKINSVENKVNGLDVKIDANKIDLDHKIDSNKEKLDQKIDLTTAITNEKVDKVLYHLEGNGKPGVLTRLDRIEQRNQWISTAFLWVLNSKIAWCVFTGGGMWVIKTFFWH